MRRTKAFVFGLDGGTWDVLNPLIDAGHLPAFARLRGESASAFTSTTWPAHTGPGWASLVTAGQPGHHGIFQFFDTQDSSYGARILGSADYGCESCWEWAARRGLTLGLVNIPMSHPALPLPGYQITWPLKNTTRYSSPEFVLAELARNGCHFQSDLTTMFRGSLEYIAHARDFVAGRMKAVRHLLQNWEADIVMAVLTEADRVCHHYWHFSDPLHPLYRDDAGEYRNAITEIFRVIDGELGRTLDVLPEECSVVVVSDHGFGAGHSSLAAHKTLEKAGLLRTAVAGDSQPPFSHHAASWFTEDGRTVDWEKTLAYMPVPGSYGLNINMKGRQSAGAVKPDDASRVRKDVAAVFGEVRLPASGKPAFSRILTREEAFPGPNMDRAADLLLIPADESLMVTPSHGQEWTWSAQTGLHRHEGMWMHRSPRIKSGRLGHRVRLMDVLPTLFEDLGYESGDAFPGQAMGELFSHMRADPVGPAAAQCGLTAEDDRDIEELTVRLKAMGYL